MKRFVRIIAICCVLLLIGCQEETAAEVAEATTVSTETAASASAIEAVPTNTSIPTATTAPTEMPTETAVPTATASPTLTLEPTTTNTLIPPTETPTLEPTATNTVPATAIAPLPPPPPPAPAPFGANLLNNPGFEIDGTSWEIHNVGHPPRDFYIAADNPQFVHSGQKAALDLITGRTVYFQRIETNVTPGTTYRAGVWVKIWSSSGEDRTISENPGDVGAQVCLNVAGEGDPNLDTSHCTGIVRPLDTWQFISVDGVAATERLTIILVSGFTGSDYPTHNEAIWDDAAIGLAPSAATATPNPISSQPIRPNPIAFNATALRDSMNGVRSAIEQAGGLLDRLFNGEPGTCIEYQGYYDDVIRSATYTGVPDDWAGIYNDYIFAVENFLATNESIDSLCDSGGGILSSLNYGLARTGINDSLNRLIPAIEAANARLSG